MTILYRAIPLLPVALLLIAADAPPPANSVASPPLPASVAAPPAPDVVAQRGDVKLTISDLRDALNLLSPEQRAQTVANPQNLTNFVRERLLNMVVLADAKAKKWETRPDTIKRIEETRDAVITQTWLASLVPPDPTYPTEAEVTSAYETNKTRLVVPRQYHIAQIVLTVKPGVTPGEDEDIHKKALALRAQAVRPGADFGDLAKKYSEEKQSADKGGDVGWLREPDMIPAVREVVSGMIESGISQPVRVPDGWHVLKLLDMKPAGALPLLDAKPQIVAALRQARAQRLVRAYLDDMLKAQPIQLNEIELTKEAGPGK